MLPAETIIDSIIEGYVQVDGKLRIRYMNANAERLLRTNRSSAIGQTLDEVIKDANDAHQWEQLVGAIRSGQRADVSIFYPTQYVWHDVKVVPHPEEGAGLFLRDVTDRQWLIRREAERTYLRNVFEKAPVAITVLRGPNLIIEYINDLGRQILGGRTVEGLPVRDALPDLEQRELWDILDGVYRDGTEFHARDLMVRFDRNGDGNLETGYFDVTYQPARDFDGKVSGIVSLSIEVTDRRRDTPAD